MSKRITLIAIILGLVLPNIAIGAFFFPEDGSDVGNFTSVLPEGYDNPDVDSPDAELPPVSIVHTPALKARANEDFDISATLRNMPDGATAIAHYRTDPLNQYRQVSMKQVTPGRYAVTVAGQLVDSEEIQYFIEVKFAGEELAHSGQFANPHKVPVEGSGGMTGYGVIALIIIAGIWLFSKVKVKTNSTNQPRKTQKKRQPVRG
ncbi:MAG: hypothetical protein GF307_15065 [candidate division Zixibacteria bacterium]|nr:hypothetical protein [candidate division Zixibacteria bacterium]